MSPEKIKPIKPLIPWRGGKALLGRKITPHFPEHTTYVEPFMGGLNVLLAKDPKTSKHEVVNDLHGELVNLFRQVKDDHEELMDAFQWDLASRQLYLELRAQDPADLSEMERAHRFLYMMRSGFAGIYSAPYGTGKTSQNNLRLPGLDERIVNVHNRLKTVTIECLDYARLPKTYDSSETLWYLDPPYLGCDAAGHAEALDPAKFLEYVGSLQGHIVISHRPSPGLTEHFQGEGWRSVEIGERKNNGAINRDGWNEGEYVEMLYIRQPL